MILNQSQAKAIYDAMCALNNIGASIDVCLQIKPNEPPVRVFEGEISGKIYITERVDGTILEKHESQNAFAEAYGLI